MADDTKNSFWADANNNGIPDKLEAIGGLLMKFAGGIVKTCKYLGLDVLGETLAKHAVEVGTKRAVELMDDKWFGGPTVK